MLQAAVKNRHALFQPSANGVRFCTLPNIFVFQFLFVIISPIMDIVLLWSISAGIYTNFMHPRTEMPTGTWMIIFFWATFQLLEIGAAALAFAMDKRKGWWSLLPLVILQRFCYRQLIYWSALRAVTTALTGLKAEWNKLERTGEVQAPQLTAALLSAPQSRQTSTRRGHCGSA